MKTFKTEIKPNKEQEQKLNQTFGSCRWIYNQYLSYNQEIYKKEGKFVSGYDYSKYINNNPDTPSWLKESSSKAIKQSIMDGEKAFKKFFTKQSTFPRYKKKGKARDSAYFIGSIKAERHRIKVPKIGWVRLKEFGYLPTNIKPSSIRITKQAGRYYVSALYNIGESCADINYTEGISIDLGIKDLAITSKNKVYKNINKSKSVKKADKRLKREQRNLSRKLNNKKKGEATSKNFLKQKIKVQRAYQQLTNIRIDYENKVISEVIKQKPSYITIEKLNLKGMMKNKHLAKSIAEQRFYTFKTKLISKANLYNIEIREVSAWYPSSKYCSCCGFKKHNLKLSDRIYHCANCDFIIDRDLNAAINLAQAQEYTLLT